LSTTYSYGKAWVFLCYLKLIIKSILFHKTFFGRRKLSGEIPEEKVLGFCMHFSTYPQIINLFEEIFIFQTYNFTSSNPAPLIFDCGSNIGLSVFYFKKIYPASRIVAFEPDADAFMVLRKNIEKNQLADVSIFNVALSSIEGELTLYKKPASFGSLTMSLIASVEKTHVQTVSAKKLSAFIHGKVEMIKIDVEGSEIGILDDLLKSSELGLIEKMTIEYHPTLSNISIDDFIMKIRAHNFECYSVKDQLHPGSNEIMIYCMRTFNNEM
jgi:FkbM family methyltransferase